MRLAEKLNLKEGMRVRVLGKPSGVDLDDLVTTDSADADAVLVFVKTLADVDARSGRPSRPRGKTVSPGSPTPRPVNWGRTSTETSFGDIS